jgi:hypothetical protein
LFAYIIKWQEEIQDSKVADVSQQILDKVKDVLEEIKDQVEDPNLLEVKEEIDRVELVDRVVDLEV